jgi:hypothetical protein
VFATCVVRLLQIMLLMRLPWLRRLSHDTLSCHAAQEENERTRESKKRDRDLKKQKLDANPELREVRPCASRAPACVRSLAGMAVGVSTAATAAAGAAVVMAATTFM